MKLKNYNIKYEKSVKRWDEALPLGNGKLGCLVYGDGPIKFAIDRIDLWDNREIESTKEKEFNYKNFIKACRGDEKAWEYKLNKFDIRPRPTYPTKLSAGRLIFEIGETTDLAHSSLDIEQAVCSVSTNNVSINSFICASKNVGVIKIKGDYSIKLHIPSYISGDMNDCEAQNSDGFDVAMRVLGYPKAQIIIEGNYKYYLQKTFTDYNYSLIVKEIKMDSHTEIYYTVVTSDDGNDIVEQGKSLLDEASNAGYDKLFNEHVKEWKKYWRKSEISVLDKEIEETYYRSWYLFRATSVTGGYPMPLQGVWTADNDMIPPWRGDYHHDTNTEMSYWGYGKANRLEEGKVFSDYLWNLKDKFKTFSEKFFDVSGYLLPATSSINGEFMGGWSQYSLSPTMSIWASKSFDDYYRYSGDKNYLRTRAYPYLKGVEHAISRLFIEKNGKYYLPLSTSPEIYEEKQDNFKIGNTNFDQALLLWLYKTLISYCKELNKDSSIYEKTLTKLDDIYIDETDKVLMLSQDRRLPFSHRHFSHLMCIYPLNLIKYECEEKKEIIDNSLLELEQLGTGWWVGFSFPWCATLYAKAYNGNAACEKLRIFNRAFLSSNGFHLNGDYKKYGVCQWHYRPFTLEANFAYCDALQEMLLQDDKGYIELFPAVPNEWKKKILIKNLRITGGIMISAKMCNNSIVELKLKTTRQCVVKIKLNDKIESFNLKRGVTRII